MRGLAGTNFLIRSKAFSECGWSPEYTLTEDYALGMELKMREWQCRYVPEYLAVGEAPEQVRNCFQQRSRWCKVRTCWAQGFSFRASSSRWCKVCTCRASGSKASGSTPAGARRTPSPPPRSYVNDNLHTCR